MVSTCGASAARAAEFSATVTTAASETSNAVPGLLMTERFLSLMMLMPGRFCRRGRRRNAIDVDPVTAQRPFRRDGRQRPLRVFVPPGVFVVVHVASDFEHGK